MDEIKRTVDEINQLIQTQSWFDFDLLSYLKFELKIVGGIDIFYPLKIDSGDLVITFSNIFYISSLSGWSTDTSKNCLKVLEGEEFYKMNIKYQVTQGNYIFIFSIEDYKEELFYIIAENISYEISNPSRFRTFCHLQASK